jgi:hypothetical protein
MHGNGEALPPTGVWVARRARSAGLQPDFIAASDYRCRSPRTQHKLVAGIHTIILFKQYPILTYNLVLARPGGVMQVGHKLCALESYVGRSAERPDYNPIQITQHYSITN